MEFCYNMSLTLSNNPKDLGSSYKIALFCDNAQTGERTHAAEFCFSFVFVYEILLSVYQAPRLHHVSGKH